jgi:hypothetical protein
VYTVIQKSPDSGGNIKFTTKYIIVGVKEEFQNLFKTLGHHFWDKSTVHPQDIIVGGEAGVSEKCSRVHSYNLVIEGLMHIFKTLENPLWEKNTVYPQIYQTAWTFVKL